MKHLKSIILRSFSIFIFLLVFTGFSEEIFILNKEKYKNEYLYGESILAEFNLELIYSEILPENYVVTITTNIKEPIVRLNGKSYQSNIVEEVLPGTIKNIKIVIVGATPRIKIYDSAKDALNGINVLLVRVIVKAIYKNKTLKQEFYRYVKIVPNNDLRKLLNDINKIEEELTNLDIIYKKMELEGKRNDRLRDYINIIRSKLEEIVNNFNNGNYERTRLLILEANKYIERAKGLIKFKYKYLIPIIVLLVTVIILIAIKRKRERL